MDYKKIILRLLYYPLGIIKGVNKIGIHTSRDFYNKNIFKKSIIDVGCCIDESSKIYENSHILSNTILIILL